MNKKNMGKHAYLIMAHNQFHLLNILLMMLDHRRVDIFLHIDAKSNVNLETIGMNLKYSTLIFVDRIVVNWGGGIHKFVLN